VPKREVRRERGGDRDNFQRGGDRDRDSSQRGGGNVDIRDLATKIEQGELEKMNEFQLMVFIQKISRAFTTQREVQF